MLKTTHIYKPKSTYLTKCFKCKQLLFEPCLTITAPIHATNVNKIYQFWYKNHFYNTDL